MGQFEKPSIYMTKLSLLSGGVIILLTLSSPAGEPVSPISKETVRSAIELFRQDPLSPRGRAAGEMVRVFAEKDDSVVVQVNPKLASFLNDVKITREDRALLLDAFVIGNVDSQLLRNEKKEDPYGGVSEVIEIYRKMQALDSALHIPDVEKFIDLEKRGELKQFATSP